MSRVGRDALTGFVSINVTPWMCCYWPSISPSLFVLVLCRRLCSRFPLLHTRNVTHTLSPLLVLECVLVGQRLHNTELWVPSHVFVHHEDTQASAPAEITEEGTEVVKKSSSHPIHRSHTQQQCVVAPTRLCTQHFSFSGRRTLRDC